MGGCIRKAPAGAAAAAAVSSTHRKELAKVTKRHDVFVAHHQGVEENLAPNGISEFYAGWIAEVCHKLNMAVFLDKTNLGRLLDEERLKREVAASRCVIAVVNRGSLTDPHGMQMELWWAHLAGVPVVPFYDADRHGSEEYAAWQRDFPFAFKRRPVLYRRQKHVQSKDALISAVHDALLDGQPGALPELLAEVLEKHAEKQKKREKRQRKREQMRRSGDQRADEEDDEGNMDRSSWGKKRDSDRRKRIAEDSQGGPSVNDRSSKRPSLRDTAAVHLQEEGGLGRGVAGTAALAAAAAAATVMGGGAGIGDSTSAVPGDKRFRFRDQEAMPGTAEEQSGVSRLWRGFRDPLGRREQEQRIAMLEGQGLEVEEGKHEPCARNAKPSRGILKGKNTAPLSALAKRVAAPAAIDPSMQAGIDRLLDYLKTVGASDAAQLPTVLRVMKLTMPSEKVTMRCLRVIFEFVQDNEKGRRYVAKSGGIEDIIEAMGVHAQSIELQTFGCGCLYALSCFRPDNPQKDNNSVVIAHAGGIGRLIEAMACFPSCREIQQWGAGALRHLGVEIGANRREISDVGEIKLTMRGINKRMIAKLGGIEFIVQAMLKFPDEAELQENGCAALCNLISNRQETKVRAARAGSIRAAVAAMRMLPAEREVQSLACALLRSLALGVPENKIAIVVQGGVRQLCAAIAHNRGDADICVQAVAALCNLTSQVLENKRAICEAGGLELAIGAMRQLPESAELQQQGLGLLHNLAIDPVLRPIVISAGGSEMAESAAKNKEDSVRPLGLMLLRQLGCAPVGSETEGAGDESGAADASGANDLGALFAPRRASTGTKDGGANGFSRASKSLTKPQRKLMGEVMESMQRDPQGWLPGSDSDASVKSKSDASFSVRRSKKRGAGHGDISDAESSAGAPSSAGDKWASKYGIEDLEGSDAEQMASRGNAQSANIFVKRASARAAGDTSAAGSRNESVAAFSVRRSRRRSGAGGDDSASEGGSTEASSAASEEAGGGCRPPSFSDRGDGRSQRGAGRPAVDAHQFDGFELDDPAGEDGVDNEAASETDVRETPRGAAEAQASPRASFRAVSSRLGEERLPQRLPMGPFARNKQPRCGSGAGGPAEAYGVGGSAGRLTQDALREHDAFSDAGSDRSEASEGGWIDLFEDDNAKKRIDKRVMRERRKKKRDIEAEGIVDESVGAYMVRELLGEVEVEVHQPKPRKKRVRQTVAQQKFAKALKRCADAPEERRSDNWEEILRLQRSGPDSSTFRGAKAAVEGSATAANLVMDSLDGLAKVAKKNFKEGTGKAASGAKEVVGRVKQEGLVHMVQTSRMSRRLNYGLDDDEESIFGIDGLEELGEAEAALLDMLGDADRAEAATKAMREEGAHDPEPVVAIKDEAPKTDADRLRALSQRLEQKRDKQRRVKLL